MRATSLATARNSVASSGRRAKVGLRDMGIGCVAGRQRPQEPARAPRCCRGKRAPPRSRGSAKPRPAAAIPRHRARGDRSASTPARPRRSRASCAPGALRPFAAARRAQARSSSHPRLRASAIMRTRISGRAFSRVSARVSARARRRRRRSAPRRRANVGAWRSSSPKDCTSFSMRSKYSRTCARSRCSRRCMKGELLLRRAALVVEGANLAAVRGARIAGRKPAHERDVVVAEGGEQAAVRAARGDLGVRRRGRK